MPYEAINVTVKDRIPVGDPLEGVVVRLFNEKGTLTYATQTTDALGVASFYLPAPNVYQARFYRYATSFPKQNPLLLNVVCDQPNNFEVYGEAFHYPQAVDARLCLASGFFRTPTGAPARYLDMHFIPKFDPILLENAGIFVERASIRTDEKGYAEINLIRFGKYDTTIEGLENLNRIVTVPNSAWVNLPDLLFPVVKAVRFDTPGPFNVPLATDVEIAAHVYTTDLRELDEIGSDVVWKVDDPTIVGIIISKNTITFRGLAAGTTFLRPERLDGTIIRIPNLPIDGTPVAITVA